MKLAHLFFSDMGFRHHKAAKETFAAHGFDLIALEGDQFDMTRIKLGLSGREEDVKYYRHPFLLHERYGHTKYGRLLQFLCRCNMHTCRACAVGFYKKCWKATLQKVFTTTTRQREKDLFLGP